MRVLKQGGHRLFEKDQETAAVVTGMLLDLEKRGMDAVREYSEQFDGWDPRQLRADTSGYRGPPSTRWTRQSRETPSTARPTCGAFAPGPARHHAAAGGGDPPRRGARAQAHPGERGRQLHPRRALPDVRLGADEHHPGEGGRREDRRGLHAAGERARATYPATINAIARPARTASSSSAACPRWP